MCSCYWCTLKDWRRHYFAIKEGKDLLVRIITKSYSEKSIRYQFGDKKSGQLHLPLVHLQTSHKKVPQHFCSQSSNNVYISNLGQWGTGFGNGCGAVHKWRQLICRGFLVPSFFISFLYVWHRASYSTKLAIYLFNRTTSLSLSFTMTLYCSRTNSILKQIPDFAAFWILTSFVRFPIQCYLLFTQHTLALLIPFIVQLVAMIFIILQIFIGFFVIRVFSKTRAKQFRLETLINQQKFTSTEVISSIQ